MVPRREESEITGKWSETDKSSKLSNNNLEQPNVINFRLRRIQN